MNGDCLALGAIATLALGGLACHTHKGSPSFDEITRSRVSEDLPDERVVHQGSVVLPTTKGGEEWDYTVSEGKQPGSGYGKAGRILIDPEFLLAGLFWYRESDGKPVIAQVWVDDFVRGKGIGKRLVELFKLHVSPEVRMIGPFSPGGASLAKSVGAEVLE